VNATTPETLHPPYARQESSPAASAAMEASIAQDSHPERLPLRRAEVLLIFGFWTLIAILTAANSLLDPRGRGGPISPSASITMAFAEGYMWATLTPLIFRLGSRYTIERTNWIWRVLLYVSVGLVIAILFDMAYGWLRWHVVYNPPLSPNDVLPVQRVRRLWFMNEFIVYVAILSAAFARNYFLRYRARREEAINLQAQAAQLQAQLADARLAALRTQLNPHFLFNTLHAISALVERDPRGVRRMIARLSELLRTTLEGAEEQEIPLRQEIAFIERYLDIMQIRFQGRLEVDMQIEPDAREALVPNLILQPLVENAVKHGVSKLEGIGRITIVGRREGARIVLQVCDNGPAFQGELPQAGEGVGLRNTRARLSQLYGSDQSISLRAANGGGLIAEVSFPYHTRADLRTAAVASGQ
jgi:two-component sensor histidine kinase